MNCNKPGCKMQFHVTCAQGLGLLCEEAGNYMDNVKYCGYCQHHYSKLVSKVNSINHFFPFFFSMTLIIFTLDLNHILFDYRKKEVM